MSNNFADLTGLNNFKSKLSTRTSQLQNTEKILMRLCQIGSDYARGLYAGSENILLEWRIEGNVGVIIANGDKIAYLEYGTGEKGRGSYLGKLPTEQISFYSNKYQEDIVLPNGWTYSYAKELGLTDVAWGGIEAKAQMWKTAQYIRTHAARIIREVVGD